MMNSAFQELLGEFLLEARERVDEVESLMLRLEASDDVAARAAIAQAKRELHTLKGNSGMMGLTHLQKLAHQLEDRVETLDPAQPDIEEILLSLDRLRSDLEAVAIGDEDEATRGVAGERDTAPAQDRIGASVRVPFSRIDHLVEILAEALIFRNRLADAINQGLLTTRQSQIDRQLAVNSWEEVEKAHQALEKTLNLLQELVTELGMVPLEGLFRRLGRIVHDESMREQKKVDLTISGGDTPIDKSLLEAAGEALGHLVRNAVIHGIEAPQARRERHKPEIGKVGVQAAIAAGEVRIGVTDDGGGIDPVALTAEARRRQLDTVGDSGFELLFEEGFSTRHDADLGSGRGVGLSAVRKTVERHGGRIEVRSEIGRGSSFVLRLPITASITRSLLLEVDSEEYALALGTVVETLRLDPGMRHEVGHADMLRWRRRLVPMLDLGVAFGTAPQNRSAGYVILIEIGGRLRGLIADDIVGIHDIVIKGLDSIVGQPPGISGSTILGDGRVVMILDPAALAAIAPTTGNAR